MRKLYVVPFVIVVLSAMLGMWYFFGDDFFETSDSLVVFTWVDYIDPDVAAKFEHDYKVHIKWIYFEDDSDRDRQLAVTDKPEFDVVLVNDRTIRRYLTRGWFGSISPQNVPNLKNIADRYYALIPEVKGYAAPYFWGTSGIVYRSDLVKQPITSWKQLFNPAPELRGHIVMQRDPRDLTAAALMAAGADPNTLAAADYQKAQQLLMRQRPYVLAYRPLIANAKDSIVTSNEILAATAFNGDALTLKKFRPTLEYRVPEEGGWLWMDFFVVMKYALHADLARQFINFLNQPKIAAKNAEYLHYATPNEAALKFLPRNFLENPTVFPDDVTIKRCHSYNNLPSSTLNLVHEIGDQILEGTEQ